MKKIIFILLAVGLPLGVATLANPDGLRLAGWPTMSVLALCAFGIQWLAFIPARVLQSERFYDLTGSITYIAVTLVAISVAEAPSSAQWLIAIMIFLWASRLGSFLFRRIHAAGGDQRFDHIKVSSSRFFVAWTLQGAWVVMLSPIFVYALLTRLSGIPTLARRGRELWGDDPAYQAYVANTPRLVPRLRQTTQPAIEN